ncbi:ATP-binding cassette domain-containing protein [Mycobacterium xenopi]|uniref:ATP-binding cassette domain-containing protein n=1 Tax=Mycobacterium xenopi TaxID=1789 RepID=UPI0022EA182F|nr:ATP-binding cassette domain-containing protein [Mycobacterium xenopi]MDA3662261.1 ATP-binding cassette domain-containing protein [Mycobacterium xenopi]
MRTEAFASPLTVWVGSTSHTFLPGRDITVGHDSRSDLRLDDGGGRWIAPVHLVLRFTGEQWVAIDQSRHGIYIDGVRVPIVNIRDGQTIAVGDPQYGPRLLFRLGAAATAPGPPGPMRPAPPARPGQPAPRTPPPPQPPTQASWRPPPVPFGQAAGPMRPAPPPQRMPRRPRGQPPSQTPTQPVWVSPPQAAAPPPAPPHGPPPAPPRETTPRPRPPSELPTRPVPAPDLAQRPSPPPATQTPPAVEISPPAADISPPRAAARPHEEVATTRLPAGDKVPDETPVSRQPAGARELLAYHVGLAGDGRPVLDDVSFTAIGGTLTAVVGPTSAAPAALVGIVAGAVQPTVGQVRLDGHDVHAEYMRPYIGIVPQGDVLHSQLTVEQAVGYAAELRLPPGTPADVRRQLVNQVLGELGLLSQRTVQVGNLSDGQRRRATLALELLTRPPLLVLDEPTAGLDPAEERQMMTRLRELADAGQIVVLATTSSRHLDLCDQVVVLTSAGTTAFAGPPDEIDAAMGTADWSQILRRVSTDPHGAHDAFLQRQHGAPAAPAAAAPLGRPARVGLARQIAVAARRQAWLVFGDQRYAIFLTILPLLFAALALVTPGNTGLGTTDPYGNGPDEPVELLTLLTLAAVCIGTALSIRDLVSEDSIFRREQYLGLSTSAYLGAKILVFGLLAAVQTAFVTTVVVLGKGAPARGAAVLGSGTVELYVTVATTAIVSVIVGLVLSAVARYKQLLLPIVVLVVLLSLVFSGGMFPLAARDGFEQVSWLFPSRWGFAAQASTIDLQSIDLLAEHDALWGHSAGQWLFDMAMLFVFAVVGTGLLWWWLRPPSRPRQVEAAGR